MHCARAFASAGPRPYWCCTHDMASVNLLLGYQSGGMPGIVNARELIPGDGGGRGDTTAVLPGPKLGNPF